jgi:hypothetical protein
MPGHRAEVEPLAASCDDAGDGRAQPRAGVRPCAIEDPAASPVALRMRRY